MKKICTLFCMLVLSLCTWAAACVRVTDIFPNKYFAAMYATFGGNMLISNAAVDLPIHSGTLLYQHPLVWRM